MPKSSQLTITVTPELEAFVRDRVASGRFDTASDVVREGLQLLERREHEREAALTEIRAEIALGLDQSAGRPAPRRGDVLRRAGAQAPVLATVADFVLTPAAEADIVGILDYIEQDNPPASIRVRQALLDAMRLLAERPGIGHIRVDLADEIIRFWPVFSYLVIYRADAKPIEIVRVLNGKRDVRRLLEE